MCPACLTTMALIVAGATSAGGLTARAMQRLRAKIGAKIIDPTPQTAGAPDAAPPPRVSRLVARGAQQ
jgi:hypothetical protein